MSGNKPQSEFHISAVALAIETITTSWLCERKAAGPIESIRVCRSSSSRTFAQEMCKEGMTSLPCLVSFTGAKGYVKERSWFFGANTELLGLAKDASFVDLDAGTGFGTAASPSLRHKCFKNLIKQPRNTLVAGIALPTSNRNPKPPRPQRPSTRIISRQPAIPSHIIACLGGG